MSQEIASISGASPRIYVVDDEWLIAESLAAVLSKDGFQTQAFHNPCQAMVRAMGQPPEVLITDVMMPGMTGVKLAIALRSAGQNCRILLFSGQSGAMDLLCDAQQRGFDFELLDKPVHPLQLLLRLRNLKRHGQRQTSIGVGIRLQDPLPDRLLNSIPCLLRQSITLNLSLPDGMLSILRKRSCD